MVLEHEGFAVTIASNGEDALRAAEEEPPDLVITDYMMPIMNGAELLRRMRASPLLASVPVIMVTASAAHDIGELERCDRLISKPVTVDELLAAIRAVLG
jgi:DNA-binding response OmpR family regulator